MIDNDIPTYSSSHWSFLALHLLLNEDFIAL